MCGPAAAPLMIAAAVMSAASAGVSALSAKQNADVQAQVADRNAALANEATAQVQNDAREAALQQYRKIAQVKGAQRAGAGAAGVAVDFGTSAGVQDDTQAMGQADVNRIYTQAGRQVQSNDIAAANFRTQASASRQAGDMALVSGGLQMGASALAGASQYSKMTAGGANGFKAFSGFDSSGVSKTNTAGIWSNYSIFGGGN